MPTFRDARLLLPWLLLWPFLQTALAAPEAQRWEAWLPAAQTPAITPDHRPWDRFLRHWVKSAADGINRVDYRAVTGEARARLERYLRSLQALQVSGLTREQQLAYWINLYNAATVKVILDHYPVASIRDIDISPGWFSDGPWGAKLLEIEGRRLGLDDIEHRILRPIWKDPRLHYALNCASLGCPNLQPVAFTATNAEALLDKGARDYINHPRGARVERDRLIVSSIYQWFKADFGGDDPGVVRHLRRYAAPPLQRQLQDIGEIAGYHYDWSLNDVPAP